MKILVLSFVGARPQDLFQDEGLDNLRRLMAFGCFGRLEFASPPDREGVRAALEGSFQSLWEYIGSLGYGRVQAGLSPDRWEASPDAVCLESLLELDAEVEPRVSPGTLAGDIRRLLQEAAPPGALPAEAAEPLPNLGARSRQQFTLVRHLLQAQPWSYFRLVDSGLSILNGPEWAVQPDTISAYCRHLDREIGRLFEILSEDASILVTGQPAPGVAAASPDDQAGCFILASAVNPLNGELAGVAPADLAPTLLVLSGEEVPPLLGGNSFISDLAHPAHEDLSPEDEEILRERLSGLGYIE